jgi:DNA repair exonuclease SbcCD nuclease subunit
MRIAVTADLHLTTRKAHPERFAALQDVLRQCGQLGVERLIIAGDLFDVSQQAFADFEKAYRAAHPAGLPVTVIPGNHDASLSPGALVAAGLEVAAAPSLLPAGGDFRLLLVPYRAGTQMGEHLPAFKDQLAPGRWALISHGDWSGGLRLASPEEPGVYMPLTRGDLAGYQPAAVLLGHIHAPYDGPPVHYPGSPCPLDVSETGLRRFLLFDSETLAVTSRLVDSPRLYFDETVVMLPVDDEAAFLREQLQRRIKSWGLPEGWEQRVQLRLQIVGFTLDRAALEAVAREALSGFALLDGGPDLSGLNLTQDPDRIEIARQVRAWIEALQWKWEPGQPTRDEVLREALAVIYAA